MKKKRPISILKWSQPPALQDQLQDQLCRHIPVAELHPESGSRGQNQMSLITVVVMMTRLWDACKKVWEVPKKAHQQKKRKGQWHQRHRHDFIGQFANDNDYHDNHDELPWPPQKYNHDNHVNDEVEGAWGAFMKFAIEGAWGKRCHHDGKTDQLDLIDPSL